MNRTIFSIKRHVIFVLICGDTFFHACGTLVSANTAVDRHFYVTYHDQREQILAKDGPGRPLIHFLWRIKLGFLGRPLAVGLQVASRGTEFFQSKTHSEIVFNYRYGVDRRPTLLPSGPCCTGQKRLHMASG